MPSPLVETKLYVPKPRRGLVARPRLGERLGRGAESRLTLVSAPAGFGKTTLLAAWLTRAPAEERSVAWLSLEEGDAQPTSFWTYLLTALQTAVPNVGTAALALLTSPSARIEAVLTTVLNELATVPNDVDLVLDDFHLVDGPDISPGVAYLLEHLPPQVHLVISTRADPTLPLARLRARGELVEVRAADLRFTLDEVAAYLNEILGLDLAARDVAVLEERTEGWIAALQLAALSIQGREDVAGFIAGFAGDDRYVVDYLVEEVLASQPADVRSFLFETCILDRLTGPLCDAVTGMHGGGKAMLEALDRANLFVIPLDDSRRWYRYHHLFADVLQAHLRDERPDEVPALHRRASSWFDRAGEPLPAVRHALAAGDVEQAADLVERAIPVLQRDRQEATIRGWLDVIPDEVVRARPVLAVGFVAALMSGGEFEGVERRLQDVERVLRTGIDARAVDSHELSHLPGAVELYRSGLALVHGDAESTIRHAHLAIDRAAKDDHVTRAGASALSGLALWGSGDLEGAHRAYSICVEGLLAVGHLSDVLGCSIALADIRITQGRLSEALQTYERGLLLGSDPATVLRGTADMYVGKSSIAWERNDPPTASQLLQQGRDLGEHLGLPQNPYRWRVATAQVREADGDLAGARALLDEAERVYVGDFSPNVRPVPALRARLLVKEGRLDQALAWVAREGLSARDDLSYLRECEHITLARVLLAQGQAQRSGVAIRDASQLLERLLTAAETGTRNGSVIDILVLQALCHQAQRDVSSALQSLERALRLAETEGYVRVFVGEGPAMASLLRDIARRNVAWTYARRLLDAYGDVGRSTSVPQQAAPRHGVVETLSERELDVLRLLASDLDGPAIARELRVSLNTLRTHTKSIYAKLGVNSRRAALRRAEELQLLSRTGNR